MVETDQLRELREWIPTWKETTLSEDDSPIEDGRRYSPQALRYIATAIARGGITTAEDLGLTPHPSPLVANEFGESLEMSFAFYLWFIQAISGSEAGLFPDQISMPDIGNNELYLEKGNESLRNVVRKDLSTVSRDVEAIRKEHPGVTVVLTHGKWNTLPHLSYMFMYHQIMESLLSKGISEKDVVFVVANDTNKDIQASGAHPFLNTAWRISANSYLPYDFICSSGDFSDWEAASEHWIEQYKALQPDFVVVEHNQMLTGVHLKNALDAGVEPLIIERMSMEETDEEGFVLRTIKPSTSSLYSTFELDPIVFMQFRLFVVELDQGGAFLRKANWKKFLQERSLL